MGISAPPAQSPIKSIQTYSLTSAAGVDVSATITAVNTAKAVVIKGGEIDSSSVIVGAWTRHRLVNSTTVTVSFDSTSGSDSIIASGTVVEFN